MSNFGDLVKLACSGNVTVQGINSLITGSKFFITASKTAAEGVRPFFIRANGDGGQASKPVILRVER